MVVKPLDFLLRGRRGIAQPAVKCRGREYLRIIYGPDYTTPLNKRARWATSGLIRGRDDKQPRAYTRAAFR
jgi:protein phosphatase